ncbi:MULTISPECIES: phage terminase small subunit P27 family [unclassified Paenibacillus]|uniref:phage terminase small subunit P27 family n=1 Tax=unclassified Paenibacillus TaxID=185978 RepID=UPI0009A86699|nr:MULTISPECIES: phage terminase small subunit P27 family [unclassified Paenibacillus]SLJ98199.1 phage terminase, small subunit, putative, P27 family [Paenibacillus sp. RU5A]SOC66803.1 phage terminase, small subunit, putative, P27 family [Paenibacillus sp. RU26A]SOC70048.1 phage terminase, small subunit, putative, P27 family [Paenibacillus sp. RU5M]
MARPRQPIDLLLYKGQKNLTKQEIEERKAAEIKAPSDKIRAPSYLPKDLRRDFKKISDELIAIGIMSNLDVDALCRYLISRKLYLQVTNELLNRSPIVQYEQSENDSVDGELIPGTKTVEIFSSVYADLTLNQDKFFKQCRQAASDLGLTISSRCKLVVPKQEEKEPSDVEKRFSGV